jgi:hypothetical protein
MTDARATAPVEVAVVEFPGDRFNVEIVPALAQLVDDGVVTILDLVFVVKGDDGEAAIVELATLDDEAVGAFEVLDGEVNGLLTEGDCEVVAGSMRSGSTAAVIVWEQTWARSLRELVADAGGRLVLQHRLEPDAVRAAIARASR